MGEGFNKEYVKTVATDFYIRNRTYTDPELGEVEVKWKIWDLAGEPAFDEVRDMFFDNAEAGIAVYDISRRKTYQNLPHWIDEFTKHAGEEHPLILIGNKKDLREKGRTEVPPSKGKEFATKLESRFHYKVPFIETSAKTGANIEKALQTLADQVLKWAKKTLQ